MLWRADQKRYEGPSDPARPASAVNPAALGFRAWLDGFWRMLGVNDALRGSLGPSRHDRVWNAVVLAGGEPGNRPEVLRLTPDSGQVVVWSGGLGSRLVGLSGQVVFVL